MIVVKNIQTNGKLNRIFNKQHNCKLNLSSKFKLPTVSDLHIFSFYIERNFKTFIHVFKYIN